MLQLVGEMARRAPHRVGSLAGQMRRSRAHGHEFLWREMGLDPARLHYSPSVVAYLRAQHEGGRRLVLASGSTQPMADAVAEHLGIFSDAIGAIPPEHLTSTRKARRLADAFGERGFDYAGNSSADIPVWAVARAGVVCNASAKVLRAAREVTHVVARFDDRRWKGPGLQDLLALLDRNP